MFLNDHLHVLFANPATGGEEGGRDLRWFINSESLQGPFFPSYLFEDPRLLPGALELMMRVLVRDILLLYVATMDTTSALAWTNGLSMVFRTKFAMVFQGKGHLGHRK